jgi:hypothetical protein
MVAGFRTTLSPLTSWFRIPLMARCTRYNIIWQSFSGACNKSVVKHHNPNPNPNRNKFDNVNIFYDLLLRRNMSTLFYRRFILSDTLTSFWLVNNPIIVKQRILGFLSYHEINLLFVIGNKMFLHHRVVPNNSQESLLPPKMH